ncbi:MAG: phospholipid carrier-dependent glycosyltransferase, partial [Deltaproteobacteria bacterium]|nr:phospholipid carrier-dependent glycosyltransferase [Deltaproteobacteria bacterium]
ALTFTFLCNSIEVLQILNTGVFLDARDLFGMTISVLNVAAFFIAAAYVLNHRDLSPEQASVAGLGDWLNRTWLRGRTPASRIAERVVELPPLPWTTVEAAAMALIVGGAALVRFWHLGHPAEIVFDEVHFVGQARHYIHNEQFLDPHPPLAKLLIAGGILLFGDHPWSWRLANAVLGTLLVAVTWLLVRRMFHSRLASALAAALIAGDGFFIVDSRIGCIDIVYLTFAAIAYLLLFCFIQTRQFQVRKRLLLSIGVVLGLCLGSKLYVPGITFLLVGGFLLLTIWRAQPAVDEDDSDFAADGPGSVRIRVQWMAGAAMIVGSLSAIFYLATFLPHYALGWWGGIADLLHYYKDVMWYENSVATATHPYASPWWSWPLMLRPVAYWQSFPPHGAVATIWGAGNPLTWGAIVTAITITAVRTLEHPNLSRAFILIGFVAYYVIWIPIGRILFLYHYMPSAYIGYLALAAVLADLWNGAAEWWEGFALLLTTLPVIIIGAGHIATVYQWGPANLRSMTGLPLAAVLFIPYLLLARHERLANRFVFAAFSIMALVLFIYYLPVWLGTPVSRDGYYARMWLEGPGLRNWI